MSRNPVDRWIIRPMSENRSEVLGNWLLKLNGTFRNLENEIQSIRVRQARINELCEILRLLGSDLQRETNPKILHRERYILEEINQHTEYINSKMSDIESNIVFWSEDVESVFLETEGKVKTRSVSNLDPEWSPKQTLVFIFFFVIMPISLPVIFMTWPGSGV